MRFLVLAFSLFIAACVPVPHYEELTPPMDGVVLQDDQPVPGAQVTVSYAECCGGDHSEETTVTDPQGKFKLAPLREFHFFYFIAIVDRLDNATLTIKSGDKEYMGFPYAAGHSAVTVDFRCELDPPATGPHYTNFCKLNLPKRD